MASNTTLREDSNSDISVVDGIILACIEQGYQYKLSFHTGDIMALLGSFLSCLLWFSKLSALVEEVV